MNIDLIRGAKGGGGKGGGGGKARTPVESPDSLRSRQYAKVVDLISEGEIWGLVDGLKSVYLEDTPIQSADGTINFSGIALISKVGTQSQAYIEGLDSVEAETQVSTEVLYSTSVTRTISNINANGVRITISVPQLTYQNLTNGDLSGTSFSLAIDIDNNGGGYVETLLDTVSGKTTSKYLRSYRLELPSPGPWNIRVRRLTADSVQSNLQNSFWWASYTTLVDSKLRYPNSAICALAIDSEQFTSIPRRGYDIKGLMVQIPSNYNPDTRVYTGAWDGTFDIAWTDNPAWCFYDIVTNTRYGLGNFISVDQIDKWSLYTIGKYCDELVPNGFGGTEPRFTCNLFLQTQEEAYSVITNFASIFRGMVYWAGGTIVPVQDSPQDISMLFSPSNVVGGQFKYEGSSIKARHTVALVSWNDPDDNYRQKIEYVEDVEGIARFGIIQTDILAVGCTSRGQAHRLGRWLIYTERMESETISFRIGLDGINTSPGAIIQTTDPIRAGVRMGGRINAATTSTITLDASITILAGSEYTLWVSLPNGLVESRLVITIPSTTNTLVVETPYSDTPQVQSMWVLSASTLAPETWRVLAIREVDQVQAEIVAMAHDSRKFDAIEQDLILEPLKTSSISLMPTTPSNIIVSENLYLVNPSIVGTRMTISWLSSAPYYEVSYRLADQNWTLISSVNTSIDVYPVTPGIYEISIVAINSVGVRSSKASISTEIYGKLAPPSDITGLSIQAAGGLAILSWLPHPDLDVQVGGHIAIRHCSDIVGATWETSISIGQAVSGNTTIAILPLKSGTYLVRAQDSSDILSLNAASASTKQASMLVWSPVTTLQEDNTFLGVHTGTGNIDGLLQLIGAGDFDNITEFDSTPNLDYYGGIKSEGIYDFATGIDLGTVQKLRLTSLLSVQAVNIFDDYDARLGNFDDWLDFDGTSGAPVDAWVEVRSTDDNPVGTPTWTAWHRLDASESIARAYDFRTQLTSQDPSFTIQISQLRITAENIV